MLSAETLAENHDWLPLVESIRRGEQTGMQELYRVFSKGIRSFVCRHVGQQEMDDRVHNVFLNVVRCIQRGGLRDPQRLMGLVRTVVRRQIADHIDAAVKMRHDNSTLEIDRRVPDGRSNPEQEVASRQRVDLMKTVLRELSEKDREILTRFYLKEQTQKEICMEMDLTETQFRLLKSRARSRFGDLGKEKVGKTTLTGFAPCTLSDASGRDFQAGVLTP